MPRDASESFMRAMFGPVQSGKHLFRGEHGFPGANGDRCSVPNGLGGDPTHLCGKERGDLIHVIQEKEDNVQLKNVFFYVGPIRIGRFGFGLLKRWYWIPYTYRCPMWRSMDFGPLRFFLYPPNGETHYAA